MTPTHVTAGPSIRIRPQVATKYIEFDYTARVALDARTKAEAYRLRYESYLNGGFIDPDASRMFSDVYDDLPNSYTIVIYSGGNAIGSVRTCFLSATAFLRSPGADTFPNEINALLQSGRRSKHGSDGVELTRLVRSPQAANNQGLVFLLWRLAGYMSLARDCQTLVSCVRQNHASFYKRLRLDEVADPKPYPGLKCPMQLLAQRRDTYDAVRRAFPIIDPEPAGDNAYEGFLHGEVVGVRLNHPL